MYHSVRVRGNYDFGRAQQHPASQKALGYCVSMAGPEHGETMTSGND